MPDRYFVDTNILVYAHDLSAGVKYEKSRALVESLWKSGTGILSTQVLQELCVNLRRKARHPLSSAQVRQIIADYSSWEIVVNTPESVIEALDIEERYTISFWDALIIQAAESAGASVLYSGDLANSQQYGSVQVRNPLT